MLSLKKLLFLFRSRAGFFIYIVFFKTKLKNLFFKRQIIKKKREHEFFLKNKKISHDYFSSHAFNFFEIGCKFKKFNFLEIGSFEGNSAMFMAKNFKDAQVDCIDNWVGTEEYQNLKFSDLEKNFDYNVDEFKNIKKFKMLSDDFFKNNNSFYDVIYVDGYHKGYQVFKDFINSWKILNNNGVIIFDDYIWQFFKDIRDNPCFVINKYLAEISNEVRILKVSNSQLFIQKKL